MKDYSLRVLSAAIASTLCLFTAGCSPIHEPNISSSVDRGQSSAVEAQISYAKAHFKTSNGSAFGDLGGTDCVNFTSQTLLARGWSMTPEWFFKATSSEPYSRAWISSTAFRDYLDTKPELAKAMTWAQRDEVVAGDVVQFDWDDSGDRDHTAIISGITHDEKTGERVLLVSSHSPSAFDWPIKEVLAEQPGETAVYFWHLSE